MIITIAWVLFLAFRIFMHLESDDASDQAEAGRLFGPRNSRRGA